MRLVTRLIFFPDPDAPQPDNPFLSNYLHWLMVNNPGCSTKEGKTLADYMAPSPPPISGKQISKQLQRNIFL